MRGSTAAGVLLADARRRPGRVVLTGLAIAVATAFAAGTLLLSETLRGYVAAVTQETPAAAAAVLTGPDLDEAAVRAVPGVAGAVALRRTYATVGATLWEVSSDPMTGPLSRLPAPVAGRMPAGPGEVLAGAGTAARTGIAPGTVLTIVPEAGPPAAVTVTGVVEIPFDQNDELVGSPELVAALGGQVEQVDVAAAPGVDPAALVADLATATGAEVRTGAERRAAETREASASVTAVLIGVGVFAGLALVAAAVVVASTLRILLTRRRTQIALLRCVGAGRGQVVAAVLAEAAVTGLVAGLLGVGAAVAAGYGVVGAAALAGVGAVPALVVPAAGLAGCVLVAVVATVLAAVGPAVAASRIPPVAALGTAADGESGAPLPLRRLTGAAALVAGAAALATAGGGLGAEAGLVLLAASGMTVFAAIVTAGPVLVRALAATLGRTVATLGGPAGRLAVANALQVPRRTAATVSVLALGVGLTSALLVGLASTEVDAQRSLDAQFPSEVVVTGAPAAVLAASPRLVVTDAGDGTVLVDPAPGVDAAAVREAIGAALAARPGALVEYATEARAELESVLLTLRVIGLGLVGMTLLVAVVGVAVTLLLSVTERTRETGLLRAVGLDRPGARRMVAWEAALAGSGAAVLGAAVGALYGVLGLRALDVGAGFVPDAVPALAVLVTGVVAVAVLASAGPAVRAARVPPVRALADR